MTPITRIATDVGWLPISFVNVYFLGHPGGPWVLVDAGLPGRALQIRRAAEARFGSESRPEAIILTHGHFDHAGSAWELADYWDVPIYAHPLELPYLTGVSSYPPPDPTIGGAIAFLSRFMPSRAFDFSGRVLPLETGEIPFLPGWESLSTTGHAPGHISLFRPEDAVLLAGDAFATMDMDSWVGLISARQSLARGGAPFNHDWEATWQSVRKLAALRPSVAACGHGIPICDTNLPARLERFVGRFRAPSGGRYVQQPAVTDRNGIVSLPPPPFDPVPIATAAGMFTVGLLLGTGYLQGDGRK
ncbi:MAG: MBL fold metallo-hydrolase [Chthoniobacterales bacterium]|nr:MBL fold metallo-hydrolase [Chthoniobacterales bacterium]